jgi:hypothetical protein
MRLPFPTQGGHHGVAVIAQQLLKKHAEHCDEPQEEEGGGDLSHRLSPLLSTAKRRCFDFDPAPRRNMCMFMFCSVSGGLSTG